MKPFKPKLQYVEWRDHSSSAGWADIKDIRSSIDLPMVCKTVGWLVAEGKKEICIAATVSPQSTQATARMHIIKANIIKRKTLKKV